MKLYLLLLLTIVSINLYSQSENEKQRIKDSLKYVKASDYEIDDVVIVGTRTTEKVIDIPYSVFRVDKKELGFGKKISAKDVLADVPGLFLQNRYGNHDLRVSLRGFGTRSNSGVRGIRILQDGIPESEPDGESVIDAIDLTSLGGVEVVKGNLSSLYANAPGGIINFISDIQFPKNYFALTNQFGGYGYRQNGFKLGIKTNENRFFVSYRYRNLDGFRKHGSEYQHLVNAVYEAYLKKGTISVLGNYVNGLIRIPGSLTKEEYEADPFQVYSIAESQDFRRYSRKGRLAVKYNTHFGNNDQYEFEISGYGGIKEMEKADINIFQLSTRYSVGSTMRFAKKGELFGLKNVITVGMDYAYQSGPYSEFENVYGQKGISVQNSYDQYLSNLGVFFLDHVTLVENKLDLFLSGRYDKNVFTKQILIPFGYTDTARSYQRFTPKVGLNYKILPYLAVYSSYGLGYDFPALSELSNNPFTSNPKYSINPDLGAQQSSNFELGVKGNLVDPDADFMPKLFFEVTYFNYLIKDEIVPYVINQRAFFRNAAKTSRQGIEIGFKSHPLHDMEVTINYTYTFFKYKDYRVIEFTPSGQQFFDYTGNKVPSVPQHIFNFIVNKDFELTDDIKVLLLWDCDYISDMYVNDANNEKSAGFFYGNFMAGLNFTTDSYNITGYVSMNNVFDKRYVGFININDYYKRYYETGEPRNYSFGINLTYKY